MIDITLRPLTAADQTDLDHCDSAFLVEAELCLRADRGRISYTVEPVAPYVKSYADRHDSRPYIEQSDHAGWLAYAGDRVAGQILVQEHWNRLAIIRDIAVDPPYRRNGIGHRLIAVAVAWAQERELAGVMLETQNVNVPACRFYETCGFYLGGMDRCLYRGIDPLTREIALYYYLLF